MRLGLPLTGLLLAIATSAAAQTPPVEVRLGLLWPDLGPPASRLPGADVNGEVLLDTPLTSWSANLPAWLRWATAPRVNVGGTANTAGATHQGYAGLTWTVPITNGLLREDDGLSFGFSIGPDLLGGAETPHGLDQGPQFRFGAEVGYQVTSRVGLFVQFNHITSGPLTHETDSLNELGVRVGLNF